MTYRIAAEGNFKGHKKNNIQATINLGLKQGYDGFDQEKQVVLAFLTGLYVSAEIAQLPFVVRDTVIAYAYPKGDEWVSCHEPALELVSDKSPLYAHHLSEDEWKQLVEQYAHRLGNRFEQFRVYVTYAQVETKIFQRS
ncbi:hypothetical protein ACFL08_04715 [Patescibacteria group bacterium]